MKRVLWFSRHDMTAEQAALFTNCEVTKVNGSPANVHVDFTGSVDNGPEIELLALKHLVKGFDIIAIVAPIGMQQQFLQIAEHRPVIYAKTRREVLEDGQKVVFNFDGWEQLIKIEVVTQPYINVFANDICPVCYHRHSPTVACESNHV